MSDSTPTRSHETVEEFKSSPETIWKAITDAEELMRWFAPQARVEPGPDGRMEGGTMWISWGPGMDGTSVIEIWEPEQHLRIVATRSDAPPSESAPVKVAVDYFIEAKEGRTVLRLVHSGFGHGADWDGEYEGTKKGWPIFFRVLKHNLEQHPGEPVRQIVITLPVSLTPEEQWTRVLGGQLEGLRAGDRYTVRMPTGDLLEGTLDDTNHRGYLTAVVDNWNRALMAIYCETHQRQGMFTIVFVLSGPEIAQGDTIESRWRESLKDVFSIRAV